MGELGFEKRRDPENCFLVTILQFIADIKIYCLDLKDLADPDDVANPASS
jgi:hypothetical protein